MNVVSFHNIQNKLSFQKILFTGDGSIMAHKKKSLCPFESNPPIDHNNNVHALEID
jgi:hypothetical protein